MMSDRLSGKVCVITGTGGSVGRAPALAFAREGALVVGCDVNVVAAEATVEMVRAQGGNMISLSNMRVMKVCWFSMLNCSRPSLASCRTM